jgi:cellulose synthase/poly-beta-1,6-N-acetylglucosamine synthase-like glycosyltransferase
VHESSTDRPTITAIVASRNEERSIEPCVRSLLGQQDPEGGFEVIVADGMSEDNTRALLAELQEGDSRLKVIDNVRRITPAGFNAAIRKARGRYIAIMSAHARYPSDYLVRCLELAEQLLADNVGGAAIAEGGGYVQRAIAASHHSPFAVGGASWHSAGYEGRAATVFGGFYRRDVFDRIGMFDEELVRNQDDELNFRLELAGGTIWQSPRVRSWYTPRASLWGLFRQYRQYGYWKVRVLLKHGRTPSLRHYVPAAFFIALVGALALSLGALLVTIAWPGRTPAVLTAAPVVVLVAIVVSYAVVLLVASVTTAARAGFDLLPILPATFAAYHFGYGLGFVLGLFDFVVLRRQEPATSMSQLTR